MRRHVPQLYRPAAFIPLDEEETLAHEHEVDFMQPPDRRTRHLVQRVRVVHKVEERMARHLNLRPVLLNTHQLSADVCEVACDTVNDRKAGAG